MSKKTDDYMALAQALDLKFDKATEVLYGKKEGYQLALYAVNANFPYQLCIHTAAKDPVGRILTKDDFKELTQSAKPLGFCRQEGNNIIVNLKNYPKREQLIGSVTEGVNALIGFLKNKGFYPCCSTCGQSEEVASYLSNNSYFHLCESCASRMMGNADLIARQKAEKQENIIGGVIGALIGSLLGVLSIALFGMMGYVAAISGVIMAVGALKGYEMLAGKLSKLGIAVSAVFLVIMPYVGNRLDFAVDLLKREGDLRDWNLIECFLRVTDRYESSSYLANLAMTYFFVLLGAVPIIAQKLKEGGKTEGQIVKIGGSGKFESHVQ